MSSTILNLLDRRFSTRSISTKILDSATVHELAKAAGLAPSCFNKQPWRFLFLQSDDALRKGRDILKGGNRDWAVRAPLLVLGISRKEDDCVLPDGRAYHQFDLGLSVMNLMLAATERGLVARPMAGFSSKEARTAFNLEDGQEPLILLAIGYPDEDESHLPDNYKGMGDKPRERKPVEEIVTFL